MPLEIAYLHPVAVLLVVAALAPLLLDSSNHYYYLPLYLRLELLLNRGEELICIIQLLPSKFNIIAKTENIQINNVEIFR